MSQIFVVKCPNPYRIRYIFSSTEDGYTLKGELSRGIAKGVYINTNINRNTTNIYKWQQVLIHS